MLPEPELSEVISSAPLIAVGGPWTRVLGHHLLQGPPPDGPPDSPPQPLWPGGPARDGARFTPKGAFATVYLATDPVTALMEVTGIFLNLHASMVTLRTPPWTLFAVDGVVDGILDLTDPELVESLGTSLDALSGNWRLSQELFLEGDGPLPPTQLLGNVARESGRVAGLRYHSAKNPGKGLGFAVFPDRLGSTSHLEVYDPNRVLEQRLP